VKFQRQKRLSFIANSMGNLPYMERLKRLHLWSLEKRRNRSDLIEVFEMMKGYMLHVKSVIFYLGQEKQRYSRSKCNIS